MHEWIKEFDVAITVCDRDAIVTYMNDKAIRSFAKYGGAELIGKSLYDVHPEHCNVIIRKLLETGESHSYTIDKAGIKKLIYQKAWFRDSQVAGLVEFSLELPAEMPHYVRS